MTSPTHPRIPTPPGVSPNSRTWPLVLAMAVVAERQMQANAHKDANGERGWLNDEPSDLMRHLLEEVEELDRSVAGYFYGTVQTGPVLAARAAEIRREAGDVVNMAMMVMDRAARIDPIQELGPVTMTSGADHEGCDDDERGAEVSLIMAEDISCMGASLYALARLTEKLGLLVCKVNEEARRISGTNERHDWGQPETWASVGMSMRSVALRHCSVSASEAPRVKFEYKAP